MLIGYLAWFANFSQFDESCTGNRAFIMYGTLIYVCTLCTTCVYIYVSVCNVCMYVCMYVCVYVCMYAWMYIFVVEVLKSMNKIFKGHFLGDPVFR